MHKIFIFLTVVFLVSPEITHSCFGCCRKKVAQHVLPQSSAIGRYRTTFNEIELRMSAFLYNAVYVYNIQPEDQINHDDWYAIEDSIKYDDGAPSQTFRTDYIRHLHSECKTCISYKKGVDDKDMFLVASILSQEKDNEIGRFVIQAGKDINNRHPKPIAPKNSIISLHDIHSIQTYEREMQQRDKLEAIKIRFETNRQEFYKEVIPTLHKMYSKKCAELSSSSNK